MKHRSFGGVAALLLALVVVATPARSQADCPPPAAEPSAAQRAELARRAVDRGFLWRLRKDGRTSYLYGTLHVARPEWSLPGPAVARALAATQEIALEIDPLDSGTSTRLADAMKPGDDPPLPPALKARLAAQVRAACLPEAIGQQLSPEMVAMSLAVVAGRRDGLEPAFGIDLALAAYGHGKGRPVRSLETPELQMSVIKGGDAAEDIDQSLKDLESGRTRSQLKRVADIWAEGRFDELSRYADWCDCLNTAVERALMRRALDDRNPGLADGIATLHDGGRTVFAAVGSLHMIGPTGLPALLRQRGFVVERVPFTH